jgi:glucose-1-phosphate adenylyltransferase
MGMTRPDDVVRRTAAVVLAGGKGQRLRPLTRTLCKPALPFGGAFRCIDFSLSNCVNSGLQRIAVATRHKPDALLAHLWKCWNSVAVGNAPIIRAWRAEERAEPSRRSGTADAIYRNLPSIRDLEHSFVLVLAGDHVYKMDYRPLLEAHARRAAQATIACIERPHSDAGRFGLLTVGSDGRVERFAEKPKRVAEVSQGSSGTVLTSMGIYVFDGAVIADALAEDAALSCSAHDFSADILPRLVRDGAAYAFEWRGNDSRTKPYWRDIGTLQSYWQAHMELLGPRALLTLDDPTWPLGRSAPAARSIVGTAAMHGGGTVADSIVADRCSVGGQVLRSVLCEDVEVAPDAVVAESVLLPGTVIGARVRLRGVIVDSGYRVPEGVIVERQAESVGPTVLSPGFPSSPP